MTQHADTKLSNPNNPPPPPHVAPYTNQAPPMLLTKKYLVERMGCLKPCGVANLTRFYKNVLTHEVLFQIGLSQRDVRRAGFTTFNREQSIKLTQILAL